MKASRRGATALLFLLSVQLATPALIAVSRGQESHPWGVAPGNEYMWDVHRPQDSFSTRYQARCTVVNVLAIMDGGDLDYWELVVNASQKGTFMSNDWTVTRENVLYARHDQDELSHEILTASFLDNTYFLPVGLDGAMAWFEQGMSSVYPSVNWTVATDAAARVYVATSKGAPLQNISITFNEVGVMTSLQETGIDGSKVEVRELVGVRDALTDLVNFVLFVGTTGGGAGLLAAVLFFMRKENTKEKRANMNGLVDALERDGEED